MGRGDSSQNAAKQLLYGPRARGEGPRPTETALPLAEFEEFGGRMISLRAAGEIGGLETFITFSKTGSEFFTVSVDADGGDILSTSFGPSLWDSLAEGRPGYDADGLGAGLAWDGSELQLLSDGRTACSWPLSRRGLDALQRWLSAPS